MKLFIRTGKWLIPVFTVSVILGSDVSRLLESADQVLKSVVEIRNLEPKEPIQKGVKSKEEVRAYLVSRIQEEYPREQIEAEERLLERLGLIPSDLALYEFMLELLTEQVAGYYDPYSKTFYIADWIPLEIQKPVMAHELTHALQDQHFGLERFLNPVEGNDDQTLARNAVIEGEGFIVMLDFTLRPLGRSLSDIPNLIELSRSQTPMMEAQYPVFAKAPNYLKETLMFPYTYGGAWLKRILTDGSWVDVDRVYTDLPTSTEQILHPEKYIDSRDDPIDVTTDRLRGDLPEESEQIVDNVLGEFSLYLLLNEYLGEKQAVSAAEGWDGDRIELWETNSGRASVLLSTAWDSTTEAEEFFAAYSELLSRKYPEAARSDRETESSEVRIWQGAGVKVTARLEGDRVFVSELDT